MTISTPPYASAAKQYAGADLQALLGRRFDVPAWEKLDRQEAHLQIEAARADIHFLRHHSWSQIYARSDLTLVSDSGETVRRESFAQLAARLVESELARALIASGYINDYFALYISIYYGTHLRA